MLNAADRSNKVKTETSPQWREDMSVVTLMRVVVLGKGLHGD